MGGGGEGSEEGALTAGCSVDTSALYQLKLGESLLDRLPLVAVLDLAVYEVGNAIWKGCRARRVRDPKALAVVFGESAFPRALSEPAKVLPLGPLSATYVEGGCSTVFG